ncbi:hypothetical protein [Pseudomonas petrae]|uniref:DUF3077 domain-containing protein n=1 Tax=Pseudomonas petrae TaxID=2912190 RepID=A0ABS9HYG1_9PSED|nr:hypothetical protein [Pseudomonas petrae]MCF7540613.1 hypothetical protein [Pseudomonas petrae]
MSRATCTRPVPAGSADSLCFEKTKMRSENTTGSLPTQHLQKIQPVNFEAEFSDGQPFSVADALSESSSLLCSAKELLIKLTELGPVGESSAMGILFIVTGAKALLDSTHVSVRLAAQQEFEQ